MPDTGWPWAICKSGLRRSPNSRRTKLDPNYFRDTWAWPGAQASTGSARTLEEARVQWTGTERTDTHSNLAGLRQEKAITAAVIEYRLALIIDPKNARLHRLWHWL